LRTQSGATRIPGLGKLPRPAGWQPAFPRTAGFSRAVAIICCIVITSTVTAASEETANALTQIRSVLQAQQDAWNRGDIDGFMNGYARSASTVFISEDTLRRGWQTVRDRYREKYSSRAKIGTLTFSDLEITPLSSDSAVASGRWNLKRENDQPHGRFTLILKRLSEGWRIVHDHTSAAPPTP
jgi:ketosteroid isomerase-like protein